VDLVGGAPESHNSPRAGMRRDVPEIVVSISVDASNSKEHELPPIRLAQTADAQPQQP
jgi:hypothetical protein